MILATIDKNIIIITGIAIGTQIGDKTIHQDNDGKKNVLVNINKIVIAKNVL